jgi:erythromycin esterase-like protein
VENRRGSGRSIFAGRVSSWNLRDRHMVDTLEGLSGHFTRQRRRLAKIVVWAHNPHLGARATEVGNQGELNVGQLVRERCAGDCRLIGFTTYAGAVPAADDWGGPAERKWLRPAQADSVEDLLHQAGEKELMLSFARPSPAATLSASRRPNGKSYYFPARVAEQFDAVIHIDETRALEPIERTAGWEQGEFPETYPFAV